MSDKEFRQLRDLIAGHTGIALSDHKRALLCSRLAKRLRHHGLTRYSDYFRLLTEDDRDGRELMEMTNAVTTNKTDFFREAHHFRFVTERILLPARQAMLQGEPRQLRFWCAATSTGEEAYSLAMTVREALPAGLGWDVKILATDIDTRVLQHAERGIYTIEQAHAIPRPLLQRYFLAGKGEQEGYVMARPALKEMIRFNPLNLLDDPWPMRRPFDAIFCRNVIIYFDKETQRRLFARMAPLLKAEGYLMLGHSEALHGISSDFRHVGSTIYRRARG